MAVAATVLELRSTSYIPLLSQIVTTLKGYFYLDLLLDNNVLSLCNTPSSCKLKQNATPLD
ncbi:uncharacterized protein METZ01_LOCUS500108 [marine metagenome]|uniref:Uncharacterized protein n=1 Tax=marine metagenome TaxID=408172 RepID=A0A383DSG5_9ZZZZ